MLFDHSIFPLQSTKSVSAELIFPKLGSGSNPREYIKTKPTALPLHDGAINILSAINSGSSMNIFSTHLAHNREKSVDFLENYQIVGKTGHSGSLVLVKKGGSLPRFKFSTETEEDSSDANSYLKSFGNIFNRHKARPMIDSVFRTTKTPRVR